MRLLRRLVFWVVFVSAGSGAWLIGRGEIELPYRFNPLAPLKLEQPPDWLTGWRLRRLAGSPDMCRQILSALAARPVPDQPIRKGCGYTDAFRVSQLSGASANSFLASCPLAATLALWMRHDVQPAARELLGSEVARLGHVGSYACRNVNNRESGRRSEHATANALDVTAFTLADGRRVSIKDDWAGGDARAEFLARVHDRACDLFSVVLGPDANPAHRTHFHLDRGPYATCR